MPILGTWIRDKRLAGAAYQQIDFHPTLTHDAKREYERYGFEVRYSEQTPEGEGASTELEGRATIINSLEMIKLKFR